MNREQGRDILKRLNMKVTPKRLEVMCCLGSEPLYLSADEVWHRIKDRVDSIGLPTVYRILDELAEAGVITRIFLADRKQYYFLCANQDHHHHHFVCESCRRVEDLGQCALGEGTLDAVQRSGGRVTSHILQINGVCATCSTPRGGAACRTK
ncbi:transcriptional repressor [Oryzomonas japonica]|uniref:Transcriptional repressor n=2 Tax=Oryzomonas TaxID=2855184 RepID=A0A5A9XT65_9BACT|nr:MULTISPECIES: Fur family transcriptional regulator [Oryzomonas]KAA0895259.1 transcriptional repressor [Oryzomonas rubra]KAB0666891.1 transcriptional repressor [Oryzomonas japonica]